MDASWDHAVHCLLRGSVVVRRVRSRAVDGRWTEPGLGEWDVRSLVGHTSRALLTVEAYVARPASSVVRPVAGRVLLGHARRWRPGPTWRPGAGTRGRRSGPDPAGAVAAIAARVVPLVAACSGEEVIETIAGGMRLADYLPTRTFELVAHTVDLASALGLPLDVPPGPALQALEMVSALRSLVTSPGRCCVQRWVGRGCRTASVCCEGCSRGPGNHPQMTSETPFSTRVFAT